MQKYPYVGKFPLEEIPIQKVTVPVDSVILGVNTEDSKRILVPEKMYLYVLCQGQYDGDKEIKTPETELEIAIMPSNAVVDDNNYRHLITKDRYIGTVSFKSFRINYHVFNVTK